MAWLRPPSPQTCSVCVCVCAQDVPRTFPNNAWVQSEAGQDALRHVLYASAHHNPRVG